MIPPLTTFRSNQGLTVFRVGSGIGALETIMKSDPKLFGVNGETGKPYTASQIFTFMK